MRSGKSYQNSFRVKDETGRRFDQGLLIRLEPCLWKILSAFISFGFYQME